MKPRVGIEAIARLVALMADISLDEMRGEARKAKYSRPRALAMWLAVKRGAGYSSIGRYFGRDHTTVMASERRVDAFPDVVEVGKSILSLYEKIGPEEALAMALGEKAKMIDVAPLAAAPQQKEDVQFYDQRMCTRADLEGMNARFLAALRAAEGAAHV